VHNNTVRHRLNRLHSLTGANPRTYGGLSTLVTAITIARNRARV
jgi:sugar diacid utilization regulator